jgi:hypothetical protein
MSGSNSMQNMVLMPGKFRHLNSHALCFSSAINIHLSMGFYGFKESESTKKLHDLCITAILFQASNACSKSRWKKGGKDNKVLKSSRTIGS